MYPIMSQPRPLGQKSGLTNALVHCHRFRPFGIKRGLRIFWVDILQGDLFGDMFFVVCCLFLCVWLFICFFVSSRSYVPCSIVAPVLVDTVLCYRGMCLFICSCLFVRNVNLFDMFWSTCFGLLSWCLLHMLGGSFVPLLRLTFLEARWKIKWVCQGTNICKGKLCLLDLWISYDLSNDNLLRWFPYIWWRSPTTSNPSYWIPSYIISLWTYNKYVGCVPPFEGVNSHLLDCLSNESK